MPTFYADQRLLDPNGVIALKSFTINDGTGNATYTPDWDTDPTFEIVNQYGQFVIDRFGPLSIFQEAETVNNPTAGNTEVIFTIISFTLMRIDNPLVVSSLITPASPLECILSVPAAPGDTIDPFIVVFSPTGTNVAPSTPITASWNEDIVRAANKNITLYNVTDASVIETFDLDTAPTSGAGSVAISSVTMVVTPTNPLPDGDVVAFRMEADAFLDAAGNGNQLVNDNTFSFTVAAVAPPPVVSGDILVGALTGAGVKVHPATSYSGSSHFTLNNGFIETTAAGAAASYNGSPYSVTIDGQSATIATVANGISVDSITSAHTARDTAQASPSTDWTIIVCSGVDFANGATWDASTAAMNGTYSHPDFTGFSTNKDGDNYTVDAETTVSGGSITYKPSGSSSGMISCFINVNSNGRTFFDGRWNFAMFATTRGWSVIETNPTYNGFQTATAPYRIIYQFRIGSGSGAPSGCCVFKNGCDWGITKLGLEPGFATSIMLSNNIGFLSIENCRADGFIIFGNFNACRAYNIEGMEWRQGAEDAMRCFGTKALGGTIVDRRVVRNTFHQAYGYDGTVEVDGGITWLGFHADWMQDRFDSDEVPIGGFVADNLVEQTVDCLNIGSRIDAYFDGTNGKPNFIGIANDATQGVKVKARGTQGRIIRVGTFVADCTTQFRRNLFLGNTTNAWLSSTGDNIDMQGHLAIHDMHVAPAAVWNRNNSGSYWGSQIVYSPQWGPGTYVDVAGYSPTGDTAAVAATYVLANNATASNSPKQVFNGTDGVGGGFDAVSYIGRGGGTYSGLAVSNLDHSSVAALRADVEARFTPRAGGPLAGKEFFRA